MNSTRANLNDENLQRSLEQSQLSCKESSATLLSELAEIKSCIEENNALVRVATSETKDLCSRFDLYVGPDHRIYLAYASRLETTSGTLEPTFCCLCKRYCKSERYVSPVYTRIYNS